MKKKILIVEDEFIVANDLRIMLERSGYQVCGIAPSVAKALELIELKQPNWILLDIFLQGDKTGIDLAGQLTDMGIPFIYISANTNQGILEAAKATLPYGFLVKPFREKDLLVMLDIAQYRHDQHLKYNHNEAPGFQKQVEHIVAKQETTAEKIKQLASAMQSLLPYDFLWVTRSSRRGTAGDLNLFRYDSQHYKSYSSEELQSDMELSPRDFKLWNSKALVFNGKAIFNGYEFRKLRMENEWIKVLSDHFSLESAMVAELKCEEELFQFIFFSTTADLYTKVHQGIVNQFHKSLALIVQDIFYNKREVSPAAPEPKPQPLKEVLVPVESDFHGIIGQSSLLKDVFRKIQLVAADDTSVLILGESGTGKERIAHTIHKLSPRKSKAMVTVNCAALPLTLIESELFGHEKGAFTGANDKRIGKFEQADGGSIFLDEIGELPLEAQVKLLRVLQEKEIERLGGNGTKKINVRIITATNRNLEKEVAEGRFRLDLYYRLNVFPIELPSLRQRKEDIPLLTQHFIKKYSKNASAQIGGVSATSMEELQQYDWPGNIRELEHLIERSVLLSKEEEITTIIVPTATLSQAGSSSGEFRIKTMEEMERDHILSILKMCKGKVFGPGGAAEILNMPSTTLNSKIKKLGIKYEYIK